MNTGSIAYLGQTYILKLGYRVVSLIPKILPNRYWNRGKRIGNKVCKIKNIAIKSTQHVFALLTVPYFYRNHHV